MHLEDHFERASRHFSSIHFLSVIRITGMGDLIISITNQAQHPDEQDFSDRTWGRIWFGVVLVSGSVWFSQVDLPSLANGLRIRA